MSIVGLQDLAPGKPVAVRLPPPGRQRPTIRQPHPERGADRVVPRGIGAERAREARRGTRPRLDREPEGAGGARALRRQHVTSREGPRRREDHHRHGTLQVPIGRSFRSSRATAPGRTSGAPRCACSTPRSSKAYGGKRQIAWVEVLRGREGAGKSTARLPGCPTQTLEAIQEYLVGDQGAAHDARRRRHPLASTWRSARCSTCTSACVRCATSRASLAGQAPGEDRHGHLPREHRRHLRRHRVAAREPRRRRSSRSSPERWA